MKEVNYSNYFFIALFLIVSVISFFVIKDIIFGVLYSLVFAFFFYPLYTKLKSLIKVKWLSAIIIIIFIIFVVTTPLVFVSNEIVKESLDFYSSVRKIDLSAAPFLKEGLQNIMLSISKTAKI